VGILPHREVSACYLGPVGAGALGLGEGLAVGVRSGLELPDAPVPLAATREGAAGGLPLLATATATTPPRRTTASATTPMMGHGDRPRASVGGATSP
jgi:hypothetical protein